ncbi:recombinase family protein [Escherichia coli]
MLIGYVRVSTNDQNTDLQRNALNCAGCELIFEDKISGTKSERPGLKKLLRTLSAGDTLVVWKLDRLGRSMRHLVILVEELRERGVGLGEAATRNVGTDTGQVPDMSSFTTGYSGAADWPNSKSGWSKGPDGVITQWGIFGFPVGQTGTNVVFPLPFPARVESITLTMADIQESLLSPTTMPAYGVNSSGTSRTGFTARMSGAGGFNLCYIAKGR